MSNNRVNVTIVKTFVYGSAAFVLGKDEITPGSHNTHRWTVYFRGFDNEDTSTYIQSVEFKLHDTFKDHRRIITSPPFEVTEQGWGEFNIEISVNFYPESQLPPASFYHSLRLFPEFPDKKDKSARRPVISEVYDEFIFSNPTAQFHPRLIMQSPTLPATPLSSFCMFVITCVSGCVSVFPHNIIFLHFYRPSALFFTLSCVAVILQ